MFTVITGFEESGNTRKRNPLSSRYSVMPSTEVTLVTPLGKAFCAPADETKKSADKKRAMGSTAFFILVKSLDEPIVYFGCKKKKARPTGQALLSNSGLGN
jgi:hypothetical protein